MSTVRITIERDVTLRFSVDVSVSETEGAGHDYVSVGAKYLTVDGISIDWDSVYASAQEEIQAAVDLSDEDIDRKLASCCGPD